MTVRRQAFIWSITIIYGSCVSARWEVARTVAHGWLLTDHEKLCSRAPVTDSADTWTLRAEVKEERRGTVRVSGMLCGAPLRLSQSSPANLVTKTLNFNQPRPSTPDLVRANRRGKSGTSLEELTTTIFLDVDGRYATTISFVGNLKI